MDPLSFVVQVEVISASGAMSPGPLTIATMREGLRDGWRSGFLAAVGHAFVELPLVIIMSLGVGYVTENALIRAVLFLSGGAVLLYLGFLQAREAVISGQVDQVSSAHRRLFSSPLAIGVALSALNPYFLVWWFTVGYSLIVNAFMMLGWAGIGVMYALHVWIDFSWLILVAHLSLRGTKWLKGRSYSLLLLSFSILLVFFGSDFLVSGLRDLGVLALQFTCP